MISMQPELPPAQDLLPGRPKPAPRRRGVHIPNLLSWIVGAVVLVVFIGILIPVNSGCGIKSPQTKALAQAKQIGLALRLFASDHDGVYPQQGVPVALGTAPTNANTAFACVFPTYVQSESIFANPLSAYQTRPPDNVIDDPYTGTPIKTLEPGENVYSYVMGLTDGDNPGFPLVADGADGTGHYVTDQKRAGVCGRGRKPS